MGTHRIHLDPIPAGGVVAVEGDEAHHAVRVKRLEAGETVELLDGRGGVARGRVREGIKAGRGWRLMVEVASRRVEARPRPIVHVLASAPKGERLHDMIAGLSQVGAASWSPLGSERTVVRPREGKLERLGHVAIESMKQCGRAWVLEIGEAVRVEAAMGRPGLVVADASGRPYGHETGDEFTLIIGPEGGLTPAEVEALTRAGAKVASFGRHVMRTEVAAVVGAGVMLHLAGVASGGDTMTPC
ncbi:MAG: ribosomal RNA small subunit methyltransferase E [Phycisphaerae bacterium]|nr:MAG: ribosomal RNA small subunit methyltransferase E [Phycisphaerae bacterium]